MRITVDASVAVKWLVDEEGRREALTLTAPRLERHAPDLVLHECANVIWKKKRRGEIPSGQPFIDQIAQLPEAVHLHPGADLVRDAARIALEVGHSVYDCFYIACAKLTGLRSGHVRSPAGRNRVAVDPSGDRCPPRRQ